MSMRFLKWLIVALIAVAIALALERALRSETSAAAFPQDPASPEQPLATQSGEDIATG
jgi:hypothetical protein